MSEQVRPAPKAYQANVFWDRQDCATLSAQVYLASDADSYIDALHAEAEALQRQVTELTNQRDAILLQARCWAGEAKAQQAITKAVGEALGGVPNWGPIAAGVEALRAENMQLLEEWGRIRHAAKAFADAARPNIYPCPDKPHSLFGKLQALDDALTTAQEPEVQGERQEAIGKVLSEEEMGIGYDRKAGPAIWFGKPKPGFIYATPQPCADVRGLAASLYQACGAYDMPERILDALSAAASGEPFAHMIDGLLPCVPPSDQDVRALVEALEWYEQQAAGCRKLTSEGDECRQALDSDGGKRAQTAIAAHRQAQQGGSHGD